jgi:hypothetical protein
MRSAIKVLLVVCCSSVLLGSAQYQNPRGKNPPSDSCGILREAIKDFGQIKPGMTRREIEDHFKLDGGMQFRGGTRYIYPKSQEVAIKVDIEFKLAVPVDSIEDSPDDTVLKVSKPYLEYPISD